jgi:hypothetical protein
VAKVRMEEVIFTPISLCFDLLALTIFLPTVLTNYRRISMLLGSSQKR